MKQLLKIALAVAMISGLVACNTISGLGQDLQNLGTVIDKNTAKKSDSKSEPDNAGVVVTPVK
jgi:predicted small secreted protein